MKWLILVISVFLLAGLAFAATAPREVDLAASGGISFSAGHYTGGPGSIDVMSTDGTATIKFMWFDLDDRTSVVRSLPDSISDSYVGVYQLRSGVPRSFSIEGWGVADGPDSANVQFGTTNEVLVTW